MSLIKCPKCGEMFSDSYKTCPFCEEDEAYYSGKVRKGRGRRTAESSRRRAPSILGPVAVVVLILLVVLVVWLIFGDRIKEAIEGTEKPPVTDVNTPDDSPVTTPDDTAVTPTISLNRTVLVLSVGKSYAKVYCDGLVGYVRNSSLTFCPVGGVKEGESAPVPGWVSFRGRLNSKNTVNIRQRGKNGSRILADFIAGTPVMVFSQSDRWAEIDVGGYRAFILNEYLTLDSAEPDE